MQPLCAPRGLHFVADRRLPAVSRALRSGFCASLPAVYSRSWHAAVGLSPEVPLHCLGLVYFKSSTVCAGPFSQVVKVTTSVPLTSLRRTVDSARLP